MHKKAMQIDHFSHEHPLVLTMGLSKHGKGVPCPACDVPVLSGPAYMCNKCRVFMHKSCAELPTTINHFKHPQHPLSLIKKSPYGSRGSVCDNCHERIYGFAYHCEVETCNFDLDIVCGSLQLIVEDHVHDHSYILFRPIAFVCDVCGQSSKCKPIVCTSCQVIAHTDCASVPHVVDIEFHDHPLKAAYSNQQASVCKLCQGEIKTNILYKCVHCPDYITHIFCSLSVICEDNYVHDVEKEDDPVCEENSVCEEPNLIFPLLCSDSHNVEDKEIILEDNKIAPGLDHFSHSHPLTYIQQDLQHSKICNACARRISGPHYKCSECELFLHKLCAELPISIQHPLHSQHPLSLLSKHPLLDGFFTCACCRKQCNGYTYMCHECDFNLDVVCGSLTDTLIHDSHMHGLNYVEEEIDAKYKACGESCNWEKYGCSDCESNLHPKSAALPSMAWHKCDDQPLELNFGSAKSELGELSSDICEKERGKDLWFSSCPDQDFGHSAHPDCIPDDFPSVELGRTCGSPFHLPHDPTFVEGNSEETHNTDVSSDLTCSECDLDIHVKTLSPDSQRISSPVSMIAASSSSTRKENVYKAKLAEQAGLYEEMVSFMQIVASALDSGELTAEERNLLYVACKKVISTRRASWRIISAIKQKEENLGNEDQVSIISDYKIKIESELSSIIESILNLLDSRLIPSAIAGDSKVFYLKMKGDYHRYLAEIKNGVEKNVAAESTLSAYKEAWDIANAELAPINPIRLGLALNFSVFYYEIMNSPDDAYKLGRKAFDDAIAKLDIIQEQAYKDCTLIMHLLHDNLSLWTPDMKKNTLMTTESSQGRR